MGVNKCSRYSELPLNPQKDFLIILQSCPMKMIRKNKTEKHVQLDIASTM